MGFSAEAKFDAHLPCGGRSQHGVQRDLQRIPVREVRRRVGSDRAHPAVIIVPRRARPPERGDVQRGQRLRLRVIVAHAQIGLRLADGQHEPELVGRDGEGACGVEALRLLGDL